MKRIFYLLSAAALIVAMSSCDGDTYRHQITISYPYAVKTLFADQTEDSVIFATYDSYEVTTQNTPWMQVLDSKNYPSSAKINNSYYNCYVCAVKLKAQPNVTDACRIGYVDVRSCGKDWNQTANAVYYQLYWHNIMHPQPTYTRDDNQNVTACKYEQIDSFNQVVDTLRFQAYDKWTLTVPEGSFVTSPLLAGDAGSHTILLTVAKNEGTEQRSAQFTLTSENGAKTLINFIQNPKAEDKKD